MPPPPKTNTKWVLTFSPMHQRPKFLPGNPVTMSALLVLRKEQFNLLGPFLTSTLRELAWELRLALVSASGPPNIWAKSNMKA